VIPRQVEHDRAQVGSGPFGVLDSINGVIEPDEGLLDQVLGGGAVIGEDPGQTDEGRCLLVVETLDEGDPTSLLYGWLLPAGDDR
jgi:hypothetical protein